MNDKIECSLQDIADASAPLFDETLLAPLVECIKASILPIAPLYPNYKNEYGLNPAYENLSQLKRPFRLRLNEKRIWVLRSDFILATGVKNAYKEYGYPGFFETFSPDLFDFLNLENRCGHTTLTLPEYDYDGKAYYAGYICQKEHYLQVYLSSGRYERHDLNEEQIAMLETYIAALFQNSYGQQDVSFEFVISGDPAFHTPFFQNQPLPPGYPKRLYSREVILETLSGIANFNRLAL
jgi:hypothetical protein